MKKLKYLLTFLIAILVLPNMVSANKDIYYTPYKVGDEIVVTLDKDGKVKGKFRVIEASPEGNEKNVPDNYQKGDAKYQYVTAIYEGTVGESIYATSKDKTYENSSARSNLIIKTRDLGWINPEEVRLATEDDMDNIHNSLPIDVQKKVEAELEKIQVDDDKALDIDYLSQIYKQMASILAKELPWLYTGDSFWLASEIEQIEVLCSEEENCETTEMDAALIFDKEVVVTYSDISKKQALRPVITIHKGFVDGGMICNCEDCGTEIKYCPNNSKISIQSCLDKGNSESFCILTLCEEKENKVCPNDKKISIQSCVDEGKSEEDCIKKLCPNTEKVENPKTGNYLPFGIALIALVAGFLFMATKKKTYFSK